MLGFQEQYLKLIEDYDNDDTDKDLLSKALNIVNHLKSNLA